MTTELPRDILFNILLRLDVWDLCKFQCISKSWHFLISDPFFVRSHMQRSIKKPHLLLEKKGMKRIDNPTGYDDEQICQLWSVGPFEDNSCHADKGGLMFRKHQNPFDLERSRYSIISSCGGLLLLGYSFQWKTMLCLMNPVTSNITELPIISERNVYGFFAASTFGLGYSISRMEFKVVRFFPAKYRCGCEVLVLNDSPVWARLYDDNLPTVWGDATLAGGSLYFATTCCLIVEFDVEINKLSFVNDPPGWPQDSGRDFTEINGELGMSNRKVTQETQLLEIWMLKDKQNSLWFKTYSIKTRVRPNDYLILPLYFVDEDSCFIENSGSIFMCDKRGGNLQEIATLYENWRCFYWENLSLL